jgi:hypothetical protein
MLAVGFWQNSIIAIKDISLIEITFQWIDELP